MWLIVLMGSLSSLLFFYGILHWLFLTDRRLAKRMQKYLALQDRGKLDRKKFNMLVQMRMYKTTVREKLLTKSTNRKLENLIESAGLKLRPEEYVLFRWVFTALGGGIWYIISSNLVFVALGALTGYLAPSWYLGKKRKERLMAFNEGLPDMITTVIGSLRAGFSFAQSLKTVVDESEEPIRSEMETVLREMQYGTTMEEALKNLQERVPSDDLDLMVQTILIQKQVGGNLATVLETIVNTIRERNRIQRQVVTLTAQGRLSGIVVGCLPVVVGVIIYWMQPDYIGSFVKHPIGMGMLGAGIVSGFIGFMLIRKITTIEV